MSSKLDGWIRLITKGRFYVNVVRGGMNWKVELGERNAEETVMMSLGWMTAPTISLTPFSVLVLTMPIAQ